MKSQGKTDMEIMEKRFCIPVYVHLLSFTDIKESFAFLSDHSEDNIAENLISQSAELTFQVLREEASERLNNASFSSDIKDWKSHFTDLAALSCCIRNSSTSVLESILRADMQLLHRFKGSQLFSSEKFCFHEDWLRKLTCFRLKPDLNNAVRLADLLKQSISNKSHFSESLKMAESTIEKNIMHYGADFLTQYPFTEFRDNCESRTTAKAIPDEHSLETVSVTVPETVTPVTDTVLPVPESVSSVPSVSDEVCGNEDNLFLDSDFFSSGEDDDFLEISDLLDQNEAEFWNDIIPDGFKTENEKGLSVIEEFLNSWEKEYFRGSKQSIVETSASESGPSDKSQSAGSEEVTDEKPHSSPESDSTESDNFSDPVPNSVDYEAETDSAAEINSVPAAESAQTLIPEDISDIPSAQQTAAAMLSENKLSELEVFIDTHESEFEAEDLMDYREMFFCMKNSQERFEKLLFSMRQFLDENNILLRLEELKKHDSTGQVTGEMLRIMIRKSDTAGIISLLDENPVLPPVQRKLLLETAIEFAASSNKVTQELDLLEHYYQLFPEENTAFQRLVSIMINFSLHQRLQKTAESCLNARQYSCLKIIDEIFRETGYSAPWVNSFRLRQLLSEGDENGYIDLACGIFHETGESRLAFDLLKRITPKTPFFKAEKILNSIPPETRFENALLEIAEQTSDTDIFVLIAENIHQTGKKGVEYLAKKASVLFKSCISSKEFTRARKIAVFFAEKNLFRISSPWLSELSDLHVPEFTVSEYEEILLRESQFENLVKSWKKHLSESELSEKIESLLSSDNSLFSPVSELFLVRELHSLRKDQKLDIMLCRSLEKAGRWDEVSQILYKIAEAGNDRFVTETIFSLKEKKFFPWELKSLLICSLLRQKQHFTLETEFSHWAGISLKSSGFLDLAVRDTIRFSVWEDFCSSIRPFLPENDYLKLLMLFVRTAKDSGNSLLEISAGILIIELKGKHCLPETVKRTVSLLISAQEYTRALRYISLYPEASDEDELKSIFDHTADPQSFHLLSEKLLKKKLYQNLKQAGISYYGSLEKLITALERDHHYLASAAISLSEKKKQDFTHLLKEMLKHGQYAEISEAFDLISETGEFRTEYCSYLSLALEKLGKQAEIRSRIRKYLDSLNESDSVDLLVQAGDFHAAADRVMTCLEKKLLPSLPLLQKIDQIRFHSHLKLKYHDPYLSLAQAAVLQELSELEKAAFAYKHYLNAYPADEKALLSLITILEESGENEQLPELVRRLSALNPFNEDYQKLLDRITGDLRIRKLYSLK